MRKRRVLVANPPVLLDRSFIDYPLYASLGALSNAAALRDRGFAVSAVDAFALEASAVRPLPSSGSDRARRFLAGCETSELLGTVKGSFDAVAVAVPPFLKPHAPSAFSRGLFRAFRRRFPRARIAAADCSFGGMHHIGYDPRRFLAAHPEVDAVAQFECEAVLPDLLGPTGTRVATGARPGPDPDSLPFPAWDLIPVERYYDFSRRFFEGMGRVPPFADGLPTLPALTSRGCPYRCAFCTANPGAAKPSFRPHSIPYLRRGFDRLRRIHGARRLALLDGCANADPDRFLEVLRLVRSLGLRAEFLNGLRPDKLTRPALEALAKVSDAAAVSAESGDQDFLDRSLRKGLRLESVERVAAWCRELGLPLGIHYMVGFPGETAEGVEATLAHARRMKEEFGAAPLLQHFVPIPGSPAHRLCAEEGLLAGFDPRELYRHFQGSPAIGTGPLSRARLGRMTAGFRAEAGSPSDDETGAGKSPAPSAAGASGPVEKVIINLTYRCGNDCWFCAVGGRPRRDAPGSRCAEVLRDYRGRGVRAVDFDGGEPTLHPRLIPLIRLARRLGYRRVAVTTNGRRLADRGFASRLLLSGLTDLLVSLHGATAKVHEAHTRKPGSFDETVAGIRMAARLKPQRLTLAVNAVVTDLNARGLDALVRLAVKLGAQKVNLQFPTPFGRAAGRPPRREAAACRAAAAAVRRWGKSVPIDLVNAVPCRLKGLLPGWKPETGKRARDMVFVDAPPGNLAAYLAGRRRKTAACRACAFAPACDGFWVFS